VKDRESLFVRNIGIGIEYYGKDAAIEDGRMKKKIVKEDLKEIDVFRSCKNL
jgi:hypothetical protein